MNNAAETQARAIVHRTRGNTHGPITRLMSPSDLGQVLKPFIFLDLVNFKANASNQGFGMHPHSGIATLTFMAQGDVRYEDSTGQSGVLLAQGVEWMRAGKGVWHAGAPVGDTAGQGFQLWVALPAAEEHAPAQSQYLSPSQVPEVGPGRVLLGTYGSAQSAIAAPGEMNYLSVHLRDGERWSYLPPSGHTVAWIAVASGQLAASAPINAGELVVFESSQQSIDVVAHGDTRFVLGSAAPHPHELFMGSYSVHTSTEALRLGEAEIRRLGAQLQRDGKLN